MPFTPGRDGAQFEVMTTGLALLLLLAQEGGRITLDRTGSVEEAGQDLSNASGAVIRVLEGADPKTFTVRASKAGFFEALDAVCRAHGKVRYFDARRGPDEGQIDLRPADWVEYPSVYAGDFKILVSELAEFNGSTTLGKTRFSRVFLTVFGPPWQRIQDDGPIKPYWTLDEALDAQGGDVRPPLGDPEPPQAVELVYHSRFLRGNVISKPFRLRAFDPDQGLRSLKGGIRVSVSATKEVEVPLTAGTTVESPAGTLTVDAVREADRTPRWTIWRASLTLKPAKGVKGLRQAFEGRFRCTGEDLEGRIWALNLPKEGWSFEVLIGGPPALPSAIRLMAREGDRRIDLPFEFKNVRF